VSAGRTAQLAANLAAFERRLAAACLAAGRARSDVTLIAVTKTFPAADVAALAALGVGDFGENRAAEARAKAVAVPGVRWHFVGQLQRNKCRSVATYATAVHSVDRLPVVAALADGAARAGRVVDVFVQVSLDDDTRRGGAQPADVPAVAAACARAEHLRLAGVMAVAPMGADPDEAFGRLAGMAAAVTAAHPGAAAISAGMSGDLESAVRHGATHVRVGTALLGGRTPPSR
jgi:pyridoxal phosphate enzyme (YggS family)